MVSNDGLGRREFVRRLAISVPLLLSASERPQDVRGLLRTLAARAHPSGREDELGADLVVVGGGLGGCAAALAAVRNGLRVIMTEETDWIGGQLTQQGVPPDENQWIETIGATRSYQALRTGIRDAYRRDASLTDRARANPRLNPGNCWVSRVGAEPRVVLAVLHEMLAPYERAGKLRILRRHAATRVEMQGDRVRAVHVYDADADQERILLAPFFADATELGDLLPLSGTEYALGAESVAQTGEPNAKAEPQRDNVQGFTMCFAMDYLPGEQHAIDRPADYAEWRDLVLSADDGGAYRMLSFDEPKHQRIGFSPVARNGYWSYRRIVDRDLFVSGARRSDVTIVNWAHNDYAFGSLCDVPAADAARHVARAKSLSLSLLYWLQTEAPRPDGGAGWAGLRLRPDILGTVDGLAKYPYIREGRRLLAEFTVLEQHVTEQARASLPRRTGAELRAEPFPDSVGIGHYSMDVHRTTRGDHGAYGRTLPFQIPLGALIPRRVENLLPACKNLGVTHLTNGCYRLHPIEWNVGESVGSLAAFCLATRASPRAVRNTPRLLREFQVRLEHDGVRLAWPDPLPAA